MQRPKKSLTEEAVEIVAECRKDPRKEAAIKLQYSRVIGQFSEMEEDDQEYDHYEYQADLLSLIIHLLNTKQAPVV